MPYMVRFDYEGREFVFEHDYEDHIARWQAKTKGFYELPLLECLRTLILARKSAAYATTVIDVGAHVGNHAVYFAAHLPVYRVIAVEPTYDSYTLLQANVERNRHHCKSSTRCIRAGVAADDTRVLKHRRSVTGNTGMMQWSTTDRPRTYAPARTLFDVADPTPHAVYSMPRVSLIKVDVEGAWQDVLASGLHAEVKYNLLADHQPILAVEADRAELEAWLADAGLEYRFVATFGATPLHVFEPDA